MPSGRQPGARPGWGLIAAESRQLCCAEASAPWPAALPRRFPGGLPSCVVLFFRNPKPDPPRVRSWRRACASHKRCRITGAWGGSLSLARLATQDTEAQKSACCSCLRCSTGARHVSAADRFLRAVPISAGNLKSGVPFTGNLRIWLRAAIEWRETGALGAAQDPGQPRGACEQTGRLQRAGWNRGQTSIQDPESNRRLLAGAYQLSAR